MKLAANFHTHTTYCDGTDSPEDMVKKALDLGFTHLGFSGHMDPDIHMDLPAYCAEIYRLRDQYKDRLEILCGIELDQMYDQPVSENVQFLIGSTHFLDVPSPEPLSVDYSPEQMRLLAEQYFGGDYYRLARRYYEMEAAVYERTRCTFIGHFDLVVRFNDEMRFLDESDPGYYKPALEAMEYLVSLGIPFEINCGAVNRGRKAELYPNRFLLNQLHQMGGEILISSDAHQKELLNGGFDIAVKTAVMCGFTHTNILTCRPDGKLRWKQIPLDEI